MNYAYATMLVPVLISAVLLYLLIHSLVCRKSGLKQRLTQAGIATGMVSGVLLCVYWFSTVLPDSPSREISLLAQAGIALSCAGFVLCCLGRGFHARSAVGVEFFSIFLWLYSMFVVCCHD